MESLLGDKPAVMSVRSFEIEYIEVERPTQNVDSINIWIGALDWLKNKSELSMKLITLLLLNLQLNASNPQILSQIKPFFP